MQLEKETYDMLLMYVSSSNNSNKDSIIGLNFYINRGKIQNVRLGLGVTLWLEDQLCERSN